MEMKRFAVYYAPPAGDFADRAAHWLGRDAVDGRALAQPDLGVDAFEITREPRRYGFHATIKPPFRLAEGCDLRGLMIAFDALCAELAPVQLQGLAVQNLGGFLALIPEGDVGALEAMAGRVVEALEPFRASLNGAEIARRRPERLNPRQRELLDRYGYPFVMEEFRFHMTLSDRLEAAQSQSLAARLQAHFASVLPQPMEIDSLCLFGEAEDGNFHLLHRQTLSG